MSTEMQTPRRSRARRWRTAAALLAMALALAVATRTGPAVAAPSATGSVSSIHFFSQLDPLWGTALVGYHEDVRMRSMGSLLTCIAMVASSYGLLPWFLVPGTPTDGSPSPDYIHVWLKEMHGYRESPPKTVIIDYNIGWAFQDVVGTPVALEFLPFDASQLELVDIRLDKGEPTILYMKRSPERFHPVVVVGFDPVTASYLVLDPANRWDDSPRPLLQTYGLGWATMIAGGLLPVLSVPDEPLDEEETYPLLSASTKSPVELTAVDPDGRRLGWDPATGGVVLDVPGATYLPQPVWADPTRLLPDRAPGRLLTVPRAREGRYRFQMIATGDGPFTLSVRAYGKNHARLVDDSVAGTVTTGDVLKFQIEYSETGPSGFTVGDNFDPEANAGGAQAAIVAAGVGFDASASFDIDGTIASYAWDFGDGATASGPTAGHEYAATGTYTATLTVTDDKGATGTDSAVISVYPDRIVEGTTDRASLTPWGTEPFGSFGSMMPSLSADGRFVAFVTGADNFGATNFATWVRDRQMGTTEWVSAPDCSSTAFPVLSADGRWAAYRCSSNDPEWHASIVVSDRQTGTHERVDLSPSGERGVCEETHNCRSELPAISDDGRFVAFLSRYDNLVPGDTNGYADVFVHDRETGTTERVSVSDTGAQAQYGADTGSSRDRIGISSDGRFVAFSSVSNDLVPGGTPFSAQRIFVRDRLLQRTELVTVRSDGTFDHNTTGSKPSISADGRFVAFESYSNDLVPGDTNGASDVFVHDRDTGATARVSLTAAGAQATCSQLTSQCSGDPTISRDGGIVAFHSRATNLVFGDTNNRVDVFVRDLVAGTTQLASQSTEGGLGDNSSGKCNRINEEEVIALSADGRFVAFCSDATNLIPYPTDGNGIEDIYVRDRQAAGLVALPSGPYLGWASSDASPASVAFDASRSLHPMGQAMTGLWDFGDGSPIVEMPTYAVATHEYAAAGTYTVTLVVTDGEHSSPPAVTTAEILPARMPSLTLAPACGDPGTAVVGLAQAHAVVRPDQGWNLGNGPLPGVPANPGDDVHVRIDRPGSDPAHEFVPIDSLSASPPGLEFSTRFGFAVAGPAPGTYTVSLPTEGGSGVSAAFTIPCPPAGNEPPQAAVGGPYEGTVGVPVLFDGLDSSDPEGAPLTYRWTFEDGGTATGPLPAHAFAAPGEYWVLLVVNDGELDSPTSVGTGSYTTVTIAEAPPTGPCESVPAGPTYDSLACRLTSARAATLEQAAASRMRNRMVVELDMARKRLEQSRAFCAGGDLRRGKSRVRAVRPWIDAYARRLRSAAARPLVPAAVRTELVQAAAGMRGHVNAMARGLACPGDAAAP